MAVPTVDEAGPSTPSIDGLRPVGADVLRPSPPYAVYLLAGVLVDAGIEAVVVDLIADGSGSLDPGAAVDDVDLVGISATSLGWAAARRTIAHVRARRPDVTVIAGGVHASRFDEHVLSTTTLDAVVRGDGEWPLLALCAAIRSGDTFDQVPSLTWRSDDGTIVRNADGPAVESSDLARWLPDYDQLPSRAYFGLGLESSRGCAFSCSFCSTPHRSRWRGAEADRFVDRLEEIDRHRERVITPTVYVLDDEFTMNPGRARRIADAMSERSMTLGLHYDSRAPDLLRPGLLDALAPHTASLLVGAECGYDEGLRRIGKGTTVAVLDRAAAALAAAGIARRADFSFIIGLPWESVVEVERTVDFGLALAHRHGVRVLFNWYAQIPGSQLWDQARAAGAIHERRYDTFGVQRDPEVFFAATRLSVDEIHRAIDRIADGAADRPAGVPMPEYWLPPAVTAGPLSGSGR